MKLITLFLILTPFLASGKQFIADKANSKVSWHLHISKDTDVYGTIPLISGKLDVNGKETSADLAFSLGETKSFEVSEGKKEFSDSRDDRIYKITGSKNINPTFVSKSIESRENNQVIIKGELSLNGVKKEIILNGELSELDGKKKFIGAYLLKWSEFNIDDPIMWFMKAFKTAEPTIKVSFNLLFL